MPIRYRTTYYNSILQRDEDTWHTTRGEFKGWQTGGVFNFTYACIERRRSVLFIPIHDLDPEDRMRMLEERPIKKETA